MEYVVSINQIGRELRKAYCNDCLRSLGSGAAQVGGGGLGDSRMSETSGRVEFCLMSRVFVPINRVSSLTFRLSCLV